MDKFFKMVKANDFKGEVLFIFVVGMIVGAGLAQAL